MTLLDNIVSIEGARMLSSDNVSTRLQWLRAVGDADIRRIVMVQVDELIGDVSYEVLSHPVEFFYNVVLKVVVVDLWLPVVVAADLNQIN